jgi:DNA-binding transcriptional LysR family regulator
MLHSKSESNELPEVRLKPISRQIDLNLLDLFDAVFRIRNLTEAGQALGLSQPAMSHSLARLREMYGDPLFVRSRQGLQPTPFAEQLAGPVATALQIVRGTLERASFDPRTTQRTFRIAMSDIGEQFLLPILVKELKENAPRVKIETLDRNQNTLADGLATGNVDLAIGFFSGMSTGIYQKFLFSDEYVCVVRQAHPLVTSSSISLATFKQLGHILADLSGAGHTGSIIKVLKSPAVDANIVLRVNHFLSVAPLIANTDLIATVPKNLANTFVKSWNLRIVEPPLEFATFDITQYWHERYNLEPGNIWLRQLFESICRRIDTSDLASTVI